MNFTEGFGTSCFFIILTVVNWSLVLAVIQPLHGVEREPLQLPPEQRGADRGEVVCALGKPGDQVFRELDIFRRRFYEPDSCISSYLERH